MIYPVLYLGNILSILIKPEMKRDILLSVIHHEENIVPSWTMGFFNLQTAQRLLGEENVALDNFPKDEYRTGPTSPEDRLKNIRYSEKLDNYAIGVGQGANFAFGHAGPGEFRERLISWDENTRISQYETGVKKEVRTHPYFYQHFDYPLNTIEEARDIILPNPNDPGRYEGISEDVAFYKNQGYFTYANLNGIFSGIHYYFYPYDMLFLAMLEAKTALKILINKLIEFNLAAAENLLRTGVDCITFCDDLGDGRKLLFSPGLYRELFWPYHKDLCDLSHSYGAVVHMHSHGNIRRILPMLVEAGIDLINPLDVEEVGHLGPLKEAYGKKVTLVGGMSKYFFEWDRGTMHQFLTNVIQTGKPGGGFILMDTGGIPENVSQTRFNDYLEVSHQVRY